MHPKGGNTRKYMLVGITLYLYSVNETWEAWRCGEGNCFPFLRLVDEEAEESKLNSTGARKTIKFDG